MLPATGIDALLEEVFVMQVWQPMREATPPTLGLWETSKAFEGWEPSLSGPRYAAPLLGSRLLHQRNSQSL